MNEFSVKTTVISGAGALDGIGCLAKGAGVAKVMLCTDSFLAATDACRRIEDSLTAAAVTFLVYTQVQPEPIDTDCDAGAAFCRKNGIEMIIALGGGSVMDQAKAMAAMVTNGKSCRELEGVSMERRMLPLICVPTTAGTGSEVTFVAVITNTAREYKMTLMDRDALSPDYAVCDPSVLGTLPPGLIASCGIDALTHAIEAYTSKRAQPITDGLALYAVEQIAKSLPAAYGNTGDSPSLSRLMEASTMAGIAFINTNVGSVHALAEVVGAKYHIPHGVANSIFLPYIMEYNLEGNEDKFAQVAEALGVPCEKLTRREAARAGVTHLKTLIVQLGIPRLSSYSQVTPQDFPALAQRALENELSLDNPRPATEEMYYCALRGAYGG